MTEYLVRLSDGRAVLVEAESRGRAIREVFDRGYADDHSQVVGCQPAEIGRLVRARRLRDQDRSIARFTQERRVVFEGAHWSKIRDIDAGDMVVFWPAGNPFATNCVRLADVIVAGTEEDTEE